VTEDKTMIQSPSKTDDAWRAFAGELWQREIDVRDFIVPNVTPYLGGRSARNTRSSPRHGLQPNWWRG
jgi:pyruvate-formate lyase